MPRMSVVNGNGYACDICHHSLEPREVVRIKSCVTSDSTGAQKFVDVIGVCGDCYKKHFPLLYGRGLARRKTNENIKRV